MAWQLRVYDSTDPSVLLGTLDQPYGVEWLRERRDVGAGSFTIPHDSPAVQALPALLERDNLIVVEVDGEDEFAWLIRRRNRRRGDVWDPVTVAGPGALELLRLARVERQVTCVGDTPGGSEPPPPNGVGGVVFVASANSDLEAPGPSVAGVTCPVPIGTTEGDFMVAQVLHRAAGGITAPAGWTLLRSDKTSGNTAPQWQDVYTRLAPEVPPASYTWTGFGGARGAVGIITVRNSVAGNLVVVETSAHDVHTVGSSNHNSPPLLSDGEEPRVMLVLSTCVYSSYTWARGAELTAVYGGPGTVDRMIASRKAITASGTTDAQTHTHGTGTGSHEAGTAAVLLAPAAGGGEPEPPPVGSLPVTDGLWAHFDAATLTLADGAPVTLLEDQSGNGRDLTQATASRQPTFAEAGINGLPCVRFPGDQRRYMDGSAPAFPASGAQVEVIVVARADSLAAWGALIGGTSANGIGLMAAPDGHARLERDSWGTYVASAVGAIVEGTAFALGGTSDDPGNSQALYKNGTLLGTGASSVGPDNRNLRVGARASTTLWWHGDVGEAVYYTRILTAQERADVYAYLAAKWGL